MTMLSQSELVPPGDNVVVAGLLERGVQLSSEKRKQLVIHWK